MAQESSTEIKKLMEKAEISLILDTYDDIFSDFDPRPYNERALSEDFLYEAKKAARDKRTGIELRFLIPKELKNSASEELIRARLKDHFRKHYRTVKEELAKNNRQAGMLITVGVLIGLADALILASNTSRAITSDIVEIIFTPASWYTIWTGFDRLVFKPKEEISDELFYKKMTDAQVTFTPY